MSDKKTEIINILQKNIFINKQNTEEINNKIDAFSEDQIDLLLETLQNTQEKQDGMIRKVLEVHPDFKEYLQEVSTKSKKNDTKKEELKEVNKEDAKMSDLLQNLEK